MWLTNVIYENRVIENERLELSDRDSLYFLGHNLTLRRCTLVLGVPAKRLHVNETRMIDCTIEVSRLLKNFRWDSVHLAGCQFKGRFLGNVFGNWRDATQATLVDCDFSSAHVDQSRFLHCDVRTLRLPPWPCFTIFDPVRRARQLRALPWPEAVGRIEIELFAEEPTATVALTFSATDLAKRRGTTPEAIKAVLEKLDGVYY
ncbi:MAG: hypothetical protein ACJ8AT_18715 [Hyalangium sp.]|uniref:hypothetical protein n=1 Tax=Hyalangium sp. TaxID=2028555 RepID=UPI0038999806